MIRPATQYAAVGDAHIAYQVSGQGDHDILVVDGFASHLDAFWDWPLYRRFMERLGTFARVIRFDKRGVGLSDRVADAPTLEERLDDILAVMDAVGPRDATLLGISEGAPTSLLFAASHPERTRSLILHGGMARCTEDDDYPHAPPKSALWEAAAELIVPFWGDPVTMEAFAPTLSEDPAERASWQRRLQASASPQTVAQLYTMAMDIDVRDILETIQTPTLLLHRRGDRAVSVHSSRYMAERIPTAHLVELDGRDHFPWTEGSQAVLDEIEEFLTGSRRVSPSDRVLATVMFTDIVGSTRRATELGDDAWHELLDRHHAVVRTELARFRGVERNTTGDGFLATFDGPARAIAAAGAIHESLRDLDLDARIGLHTGEVELHEKDVAGIGVHIAARIAALASTGETLVSRTVKDLVVGSGLHFSSRGPHELDGVADHWHLYAVAAKPEA